MAAGTVEKIQVVLQAVTNKFSSGFNRVQNQLKRVGKGMQDFGMVMQAPVKSLKAINKNSSLMFGTAGKLARNFRFLTHGMKGFRMEALGVMFFGMMMQRMFLGLLQPVMEAFGVFDIFRLMLLTLFLPVMEMIFPFLITMMEWFMNLPEPVKKAIGIFAILGLIFGTIIMVLGQLALGIGSMIIFFPIIGAKIALVGKVLMGFASTAVIVIAVVIAVVVAMFVAWKENFMNMKQVVSDIWFNLKIMFKGLFDFFKGVMDFFVAIFKGDWDGALEAIKLMFKGLGRFIFGLFFAVLNFLGAVGIGIIRIFKFIVDRIVGFFKWLFDKIVGRSIIPDMIKAIIDWFWKLPKAVFDMLKSIVSKMFDAGVDLMQKMIDGIKSMGRKVIDAILGLFPEWMRKGIEASGKIVINIIKNVTEKIKKAVGGGRKDDFIWRPGQAPISINPNDTLVGFKGASPGFGGGTIITQENNFHGFTMDDLKRELDDRDRRLVDDVRRLVKT